MAVTIENLGFADKSQVMVLLIHYGQVEEQKYFRETPSRIASPGLTLFLLTVFQLLTAVQFCMTSDPEDMIASVTGFLALMVIEWVLFILLKLMRRNSFDVETIAFFLSTIGIAVIALIQQRAEKKKKFKKVAEMKKIIHEEAK